MKWGLSVIVALVIGIIAGATLFDLDRDTSSTSSRCEHAKTAVKNTAGFTPFKTKSRIIVNDPECFKPGVVAGAQDCLERWRSLGGSAEDVCRYFLQSL